ncbi:MAG: hypothetical protein KC646_02485 [Candidatus Cloacimonetes bacterium]|nr:hypothetical protein [Candidatus Cloacimonadota bacterium]
MTLAIVITFSTLSIGINDLIISQSKSIEYLVAKTQLEYITNAGLVDAENKLSDDVSRTLVSTKEFAQFRNRFCVAWASTPDSGEYVCNVAAEPTQPCCTYTDFGQCDKPNVKGVCESQNYWQANYGATYSSLTKTIVTSASMTFIEDTPYEENGYVRPLIRFDQSKEMVLAWE